MNFLKNGKSFELRGYGGNFTEEFVYPGRKVELRKGYSGESFWGNVGRVVVGSLEEIFGSVDFKKILPEAKSREEAIEIARESMKQREKYIAFEVI